MSRISTAARLVAASWLLLAASVAAGDLYTEISHCRTQMLASDETSFDVVAESCPGLIGEIDASEWSESLHPGWREELSYWELEQLGDVVAAFETPRRELMRQSPAALDDIVAGLVEQDAAPEGRSLWDRFVDWLSGLFESDSPEAPGWFARWLEGIEISSDVVEVIFWTLAAIIVIAAVGVIVMEVRANRRSVHVTQRPGSHPHAPGGVDYQWLTMRDLQQAAAAERPSILLRLLLQRLWRMNAAPQTDSLTHREIPGVVSGLDAGGSATLCRVSALAEELRYAAADPARPDVDTVVADGVALLRKLNPT